MINQKLTIFLCLAGLALVASLAAGQPTKPAAPVVKVDMKASAAPAAAKPEDKSSANKWADDDEGDEDEEDEDDEEWDEDGEEGEWDEEDDDGEWDEDDEEEGDWDEEGDEEEEDWDEDSLEAQLGQMSADHYEVRQDCTELKAEVDKAKSAGNATVDQDLLDEYQGCMKVLKQIEQDIRETTDQILKSSVSLA